MSASTSASLADDIEAEVEVEVEVEVDVDVDNTELMGAALSSQRERAAEDALIRHSSFLGGNVPQQYPGWKPRGAGLAEAQQVAYRNTVDDMRV